MSAPVFRPALLHPRYWPLWFGLGVLWLVVRLPYAVLMAMGRLLGRGMFIFMPGRRRVAEINLALCFPTVLRCSKQLWRGGGLLID
jgi:KDO2-lipid IV(A) lauroyltransferase